MSEAPVTTRDIARYLSKAFASGDPKMVGGALGVVVREKGMSAVARLARTRREPLYRTLSGEFSPALGTVMKLLAALEMELVVRPCTPSRSKKARRA
jgi:probable addiction module antidote protein